MIINTSTLNAIRTGFQASFKQGLSQAPSLYERIATKVASQTKSNTYGWLGKFPNLREWIGARQVMSIAEAAYTVVNKDFELTIGVDRNDIEDDNLGVYAPMFQELGDSVAAHPDRLVFALLKAGFTTNCYDGQTFFSASHPVLDENGAVTTVSNTGGGAGTNWFLLCANRALKPLIYQERKAPVFVNKDKPDDDNVFDRKEYLYGVDMRCNVGFGFWQMAYGSKQTLDAAAYATGRAMLTGQKGDYGRPLGLMPNLLVVPPALEEAGREILTAERDAAGATNVWKGTAELLVAPWLA